jgi:spoIIIJ-associated protein
MKEQEIKKVVNDLISAMGFEADLILAERNGATHINIQLEEPMLLIGHHGETLDALQHAVKTIVQKGSDEYILPIVIDINNYREQRISALEKKTHEVAHRVKESGEEFEFPPMNSYERRTIHVIISGIADVESESAGTGEERRVKIKKSKK